MWKKWHILNFLAIAHFLLSFFLLVEFGYRNFYEQIQIHFKMDALSQFAVLDTSRHNKQMFKINPLLD